MTKQDIPKTLDVDLTGEEQLFLGLGPDMLKDSLNVGNAFANTVIPTASGLVTVYVGLLKLILGNNPTIPNIALAFVIFALPPVLFVISLIAAIRLLQPKAHLSSPASPTSLRQTYLEIVESKGKMSKYTTIFLVSGLIAMIIVLLAVILIAPSVSI